MTTTKRYLHLAGVVFRAEAEALERRLLTGAGPVESSTDLSAPDRISTDPDDSQSRVASSPVV